MCVELKRMFALYLDEYARSVGRSAVKDHLQKLGVPCYLFSAKTKVSFFFRVVDSARHASASPMPHRSVQCEEAVAKQNGTHLHSPHIPFLHLLSLSLFSCKF